MSGGGGGGSNERYVQEQYDYDVNKWKYDKQEMEDAYAYAMDTHAINMQNAEDQINFQNQERMAAWQEKMEIRTQDYNGQVAAYNASKKSMVQQLNYNNTAAEMAMGDNVRKYNERLMEIGFQNTDLLMKYDQAFAKTQLGLDQAFGQESMRLRQATAKAQLQQDQAQEGEEFKYGQAFEKAQFEADQAFDQEAIKLAQAGDTSRLALSQREDTAVRKVTQAKQSKALKERGVGLQVTDAVTDAGFQTRALLNALQAAEAKGAHEIRNISINGMQAAGKTLAGAQAGRSMRKALQAHMATTGRATNAIIDTLTNERSSYNLNLDKVAHTLNMAQGQANLSYDQLAQDVMHLQQTEQEGVNQMLGQQELKLTQQREASQFSLDQRQAQSQLMLNQQRDASQFGLDQSLEARQVGLNLQRQASQFGLDQRQQMEELGIAQLRQQTNFGVDQLDASIDSARAQAAADGRQVYMQKHQQDLNARNSLAARPVLPPEPAVPVSLPTPTMQEPPEPPSDEQWKNLHPIRGAVSRGPSGFQQALGAVGAIAGIFSMSDDRLKRTYNRVGTSPTGVPVYTFKYIHDGEHGPWYKGTSAQDLIAMGREDAVGQQEQDGFYYVDYSKLDVEFEKVTAT